jgi:hypothetical protein
MSAGPSPIRVWVHHLVDDLSSAANVRMALAHLVAAAGLGLWLASGERLAWRLVALLTGPASAIVSRVAATVLGGLAAMAALAARTTRVRVPPPATDPPRSALLLLARAVDRRGPPTFSI